jgi:hypothetical protein
MPPGAGPRCGGRTARRPRAVPLVLLVGLSAFFCRGVPEPAAQETLAALLPADGEASGWMKDGDFQEYEGEDLYIYIDGGAEIYHEYGFLRVVVQEYVNAGGKAVSLEIFEMEDPAAAYGMFTFKRSGRGQSVPLGSAAELEDYYLNLWKGRYLATLTGFDETEETVEGLLAIARRADARITGAADTPGLVSALPAEGLRPGSVKYLEGLLGLNSVYAFHTARGLEFEAAATGDYGDGSTLIVMDYGSAEARLSAWSELRAWLEGSARFEPSGAAAGANGTFKDGRGRSIAFAPANSRLFVGVGPDAGGALGVLRRALR